MITQIGAARFREIKQLASNAPGFLGSHLREGQAMTDIVYTKNDWQRIAKAQAGNAKLYRKYERASKRGSKERIGWKELADASSSFVKKARKELAKL